MKSKKLKHKYSNKSKTKKKVINCLPVYVPFEKKLGKYYNSDYLVQKELIQIFNTPYAPSKFTAKNDFYSYINYSWLSKQDKIAKTQEKKFYSQIDSFRLVQEKPFSFSE